jgi:hypothetical protein
MCRSIWIATALLITMFASARCPLPALGGPSEPLSRKHVKVLRRIQGGFPLDGREKRLPHDDFIADKRSWGVLWQALDNKRLPEVDFEHEIVLIAVITDENELTLDAHLDDRGNVEVVGMATLVGYPHPQHGSYQMHVVGREGIKTVNGKPVRKGIWRQLNPLSGRK